MRVLNDIRDHRDFTRFARMSAAAACIWILGACVMVSAVSRTAEFKARVRDANTVVSAAKRVRSMPSLESLGNEPLTEISKIASGLGIKNNILQMGVSPSGLVLEVRGLDTETFSKLVSMLSKKGFTVKSCEARVLSSGKEPSAIKALFVIGAGSDENTGNS